MRLVEHRHTCWTCDRDLHDDELHFSPDGAADQQIYCGDCCPECVADRESINDNDPA